MASVGSAVCVICGAQHVLPAQRFRLWDKATSPTELCHQLRAVVGEMNTDRTRMYWSCHVDPVDPVCSYWLGCLTIYGVNCRQSVSRTDVKNNPIPTVDYQPYLKSDHEGPSWLGHESLPYLRGSHWLLLLLHLEAIRQGSQTVSFSSP